jgi:hypothetical protein
MSSAASVNLGMLSVGTGGTVYAMKSACATRGSAAATTIIEMDCFFFFECHHTRGGDV